MSMVYRNANKCSGHDLNFTLGSAPKPCGKYATHRQLIKHEGNKLLYRYRCTNHRVGAPWVLQEWIWCARSQRYE